MTEIINKLEGDTLRENITDLTNLIIDIGLHDDNVFRLIMDEVQYAVMETVIKKTRYNQTVAARLLGINRGTCRKLLNKYGLLTG